MRQAVSIVMALLALALTPSPARADRPGTPDQERADVIGPHRLRISWQDTAHGGSFGTGPTVNFEVQHQEGGDPSSSLLQFGGYDPDGRLHWDVSGLAAGQQHCFRIWSRNRDDDLRSGMPSAWTCATLPPDMGASAQGMLAVVTALRPGQIMAMQGQILWLAKDGNGVMARKNDGFVLAVTAGHECPGPWKAALYQNGQFPGLGNAHERAAADPYWLCWSPLLPGNAKVTPRAGYIPPPPPPAPRPAPPLRR